MRVAVGTLGQEGNHGHPQVGRQLWEAPGSQGGGVSSWILKNINATPSKKTWTPTSNSVCQPEPPHSTGMQGFKAVWS